jgi:COP9 signalosome complex subunit 2
MADYGEEEFECEWPDDDPNDQEMAGPEVELQNTFYTAEDLKRTKPREALEMFESVLLLAESLDSAETKFRFSALQNIVVLSAQLAELDNLLEKQRLLLKMVSKVSREELADAVNAVLDAVAQYLQGQPAVQSEIYKLTLDVLKSNNERLWFTICLRLARIYLDLAQYEQLDSLLQDLKDSCKVVGGAAAAFDQSKSNLLLEVFALEIQLCAAVKNNGRMKQVYGQAQKLNSVINDPRVTAIIRETGGKIFMSEKKWSAALDELFESFKSYQESGNPRARLILKYVILASILATSDINYADTREAKVYMEDKQIVAITQLRRAFEANDISEI